MKRKWLSTQTISTALGLLMLAVVIIGLAVPGLDFLIQPAQQSTPLATLEPTPVVFPTPPPGGTVVEAAGLYVHPSGAFYLAQPQGWSITPNTNPAVASASFVNSTLYSVVHVYIQHHDFGQDLASLDALYGAAELAASWGEYDTWLETDRQQTDDALVIDFELSLDGNTYLARQLAWPDPQDNTWSHVLRLVGPGNNPALLDALQNLIIPSYQAVADALTAPLTWPAYIDQTYGLVIKFPETWQIADGGPGLTTTLVSASGQATVTLSTGREAALDNPDAARAWLEAARPGAEVIEVGTVERANGSGYRIAYTYNDADGEARSGLAVLLNGADGRLVAANLRLNETRVNLLDEEATAAQQEAVQVMRTFALLPEASLPQPETED